MHSCPARLPAFYLIALLVSASCAFTGKAAADPVPATTLGVAPTSVSTFHCLSLYWSPAKGDAAKHVLVQYREAIHRWDRVIAIAPASEYAWRARHELHVAAELARTSTSRAKA